MRKSLRVLKRGPVLVCLISGCLAECLVRGVLRKLGDASRSEILHRWNKRILSRMGVQVSVSGPVPAQGLIVSNHLSYLDILVLSAIARCVFVSKSEVKWWPLVGWIAVMTGVVFVDRSRRSQTHRVQTEMQDRLKRGERLVLFPESTSSDGREVLPFYSPLFEAAVASAAPITAAHISYELVGHDGDPSTDVCYWGEMTLLPHVIKLLTKTDVQATVRFAEKPKVFAHRKQAAREMQREVAQLGDAERGQLDRAKGGTFAHVT